MVTNPRRRRVVVLNHFALPRTEPGGTRHAELFSHLRMWDATIVASDRNLLTRKRQWVHDPMFLPVRVTPYDRNKLARLLNWVSYAVAAFVRGLRIRDVDVIYASSPHLLAGLSGWGLARLKGVPFVFEVRDLWPRVLHEMGELDENSRLYLLVRGLARFLYRHADAVVVLTDGSRVEVVAEGASEPGVVVLPNGAELDDFVVGERREALRSRYGMGGFVVLYAGAHGPANSLHYVLDAAEALLESDPGITFWLVGDGVSKRDLVADARRRRLENVVFRDPIPKTEIPRLMAAVDAGLHVLADVPLFRYGASPNKLYDYMAAGCPVITNGRGAPAAMVNEAGAGLAVGPDEIARGARELASSSSEQRAEWGRNGRAFVERHHSRSAIAERLESLLDDLAPPPR